MFYRDAISIDEAVIQRVMHQLGGGGHIHLFQNAGAIGADGGEIGRASCRERV